jgi:hypothetical protein
METNYELKHKCLLVPLKVVLLVIAMVLVGFTTYAQQGKSMKVADNQQLIEAMNNPSVSNVVLEAGYYDFINYEAASGDVLTKGKTEGGNRDLQCLYFTIGSNVCFNPANPGDFVLNEAQAGTSDLICPGCCPGPDEGTWSVQGTPPGNVNFLDPLNFQTIFFEVDAPGAYLLRYTWGPPYNSLVETQYFFYGPVVVDLSAPDVCGTSTTVDFDLSSVFPDPITVVEWTLNGEPYAGPDASGQFTLDVPVCGLYELCVTVEPSRCPPVTECITIDFSCDPIADAGPDIDVCDDICYFSLVGSTGLYTFSPTNAWSWVQVGGPNDLVFGAQTSEVSSVCVDETADCPYGEYEVEFQVQNGQCYDEDAMILRFYEQPVADAGDDQHICNTFSFSLNAVPYEYCGVEGVNYWSEAHWELVSQADPGAIVTIVDENDPNTVVNINTNATECEFGDYVFVWKETNLKPGEEEGGCYDEDQVVITIYEDPQPDAGDDMVFCNTFAFSLYGIGDEPCNERTQVRFAWGKKSDQPCDVTFTPANETETWVEINCDEGVCAYGKYVFGLTQYNGYLAGNNFVEVCSSTDFVDVWIFEEPIANAGVDQVICDEFEFAFSAIPTDFCGEEGVNYITWGEWEFIDGPTSDVTIDDVNDPTSTVSINDQSVECPYGAYYFKWTEYNGIGEGDEFEGCMDMDTVMIVISETPESISAGEDQSFCEVFSFYLDGTVDMPCTEETAYSISWELIDQPGDCDVTISTPNSIDPMVTIDECDPCQYGEYIFKVTQKNGYYNEAQQFIEICSESDMVSVWIFEQPDPVAFAEEDLMLCNDFAFSLTALGSDYCGDFGVNYNNWYSWVTVSGPEGADCEVTITNPTGLSTDVIIENCLGECAYGEWVFGFTEWNGNEDEACVAYDEVSVFIFEMPVADAGDDINECVDIADAEYCYTMTGTLEYCYSMTGLWTKSCGPGEVRFTDLDDPNTVVCFPAPGRYEFTWTVSNAAEGCEASDEVIFNLLEQPEAIGGDDELIAPCDVLCYSLYDAGIVKYEYFGTDEGECPNYLDFSHWSYVDGPTGNPAEVTFADDTDPATELCVSTYGCYSVRWNEINKSVDGEIICFDYFDVYVVFVATPEPDAGDDATVCDACYTMAAVPYVADNCAEALSESYWEVIGYTPPVDPCLIDEFAIQYSPLLEEFDVTDPAAHICVVDDCLGSHYGTYTFVWVNASGFCVGYDTVEITFNKVPEEVALEGAFDPSNCSGISNNEWDCPDCVVECLYPEDRVIEVCAGSCLDWSIDWACSCYGMPIPGYTYEWSFIGPSGSYMTADPYWYDCAEECWKGSDNVHICFGECCDTARLYLTITTPQGCTTTEEWKFYVNHKPCAEIEGPEVAEVDAITTYCNVCPVEYDMDCLLYTWTAEHCGEIVEGQGTECIEVLWTDYNVNGGWGEITLTTYDTCTGCCNYDEMMVKIYPAGTLGEETLSGYVMYKNNYDTPLNGVEIQLWNGEVPVMSTTSFNDIEGGNGVGYFEFTGINGATEFGITSSYDAPWYGANATDALAVQLYTIGMLPLTFDTSMVVKDAMNVNNSATINSTDALWIKQRAISMVNYFPAGDWAFDPSLTANAGDSPLDVYALNMGDANRSNVPNSNKSMPAIDLVNDGTMNVVSGEVFELPIRIAKADQFGAITLSLEYNSALIEVVDVTTIEGMLSNITNGVVSIAWSNLNPMVLADNDVVVTLKAKATGEIASTESLFRIGMNSEFADPSATVIEPVSLKLFGVTTEPAALDYFLSTNRPNPFNTSTFIEYTMPETGKVRLSVLDMLGQEIAVLVDATQTAGSYTVEYSAAGLATGVYIYKITVDGESRDFISTNRMVVTK